MKYEKMSGKGIKLAREVTNWNYNHVLAFLMKIKNDEMRKGGWNLEIIFMSSLLCS